MVRSVNNNNNNNNNNINNSNNNMAANLIITSIKSPTPSTATLRPTTTNHANHLQLFDEAGWNEHVSEPQPCRYSSKEQACCLRKLLIKFGSSFVLILFNEILQNFSPRLFAAFVPLGKYLLNFSYRGLMFRVHVLCLIDCDDVKSIENCLCINPRFYEFFFFYIIVLSTKRCGLIRRHSNRTCPARRLGLMCICLNS